MLRDLGWLADGIMVAASETQRYKPGVATGLPEPLKTASPSQISLRHVREKLSLERSAYAAIAPFSAQAASASLVPITHKTAASHTSGPEARHRIE